MFHPTFLKESQCKMLKSDKYTIFWCGSNDWTTLNMTAPVSLLQCLSPYKTVGPLYSGTLSFLLPYSLLCTDASTPFFPLSNTVCGLLSFIDSANMYTPKYLTCTITHFKAWWIQLMGMLHHVNVWGLSRGIVSNFFCGHKLTPFLPRKKEIEGIF